MANHKSALKRARQNAHRRARNRSHRSTLRTQIKRFRQAIADGDVDATKGMLAPTIALLDRSVQKGVLPDNAASRGKSRLTQLLNKPAAS